MYKGKAYKLSDKRTDLASMSQLDDIARDFIRLNRILLDSNRAIQNARKEAQKAVFTVNNLKSMYEANKREILQAAKELGVDVSSKVNANDRYLEEVEQIIKDLRKYGVKG